MWDTQERKRLTDLDTKLETSVHVKHHNQKRKPDDNWKCILKLITQIKDCCPEYIKGS